MSGEPLVQFIYFDAGGGHRSAALALEAVIRTRGYPWRVELVNLQEVLDPLDVFRRLTGIRLQDLYNLALAKGWTYGSAYLLPIMHAVIRRYHAQQVRLLEAFWRKRQPEMVVSLVPNFNRAMWESLKTVSPAVPYVTVLTDFADFPPHFWIERQPQYVVCGTRKAVEQARAFGHPEERIFRTSGMILRPQFYDGPVVDRTRERKALGLDPVSPTGLVLFGGQGSRLMVSIAQQVGNMEADVQLILICGHNRLLRERLSQLQLRNRVFVEGFTDRVPYYMQLADFFIGKPGPGSISEALKMKLPVIVERNAWTLPQERYNADWVRENGVGVVLDDFKHVVGAVEELLTSNRLGVMKRNIECVDNNAVFEIPQILERILQNHQRLESPTAILRQ